MASIPTLAQRCTRFLLEHANAVVVALTACTILYTRSAGVVYFTTGAVVCSRGVKLMKLFVRQPRPLNPLPGRQKKTYGWPSTHSAVTTYYAAFTLLACLYLPLHPSMPQDDLLMRVVAPSIIVPGCAAVAISRIWLGHHTWSQVSAGCAFGLAFTPLWFKLWTRSASEYGPLFEETFMRFW